MAAQGASLVYLAIIGAYAWRMRLLDRRYARMLGEAA
jgi:putative solute:sodium symporter small subunit